MVPLGSVNSLSGALRPKSKFFAASSPGHSSGRATGV